jgi:hypothetical protein
MIIKLNRGPRGGETRAVVDGTVEIEFRYAGKALEFFEPIPFKVGTYRRSNVVQKNGTVVFEWMGWLNESL